MTIVKARSDGATRALRTAREEYSRASPVALKFLSGSGGEVGDALFIDAIPVHYMGVLAMKTDRLMAFTDAVLAIVITIMVIDLRVPATDAWEEIEPVIPLLVAYALAFINIGIFWTNHHHMLATASRVNGRALWANLFLLYWLSLMPFVIRWIGLAGFTPQPVAAYGAVTVMAAFGYIWLERELILAEGTESRIRAVVGSRRKEWVSFSLYGLGIPAAFISPWIAVALYIAVSLMWLIPDRRFERWHNLQQSEA